MDFPKVQYMKYNSDNAYIKFACSRPNAMSALTSSVNLVAHATVRDCQPWVRPLLGFPPWTTRAQFRWVKVPEHVVSPHTTLLGASVQHHLVHKVTNILSSTGYKMTWPCALRKHQHQSKHVPNTPTTRPHRSGVVNPTF